MSVIAVISMKGGVGKTTITANLATAMAAALGEHRVSVVDLDPQNSLHLHLGVKDTDSPGVCRQALREASWREAMAHAHGVRCLPYGFVREQERRDFEQLLRTHPHWLSEQIRTAGINADAVVLIDTPPGPSVYLQQVLDCADVVLMVVLPDAASYAVLPVMGAWLAAIAEQRPQVRHQAGGKNLEDASKHYAAAGVTADVTAFIEDMAEAYAWADLVICRAGALTVAELAAAGVAALLVPFPHAVDDHQTANGKYLADNGAALLVQQRELTPEKLAAILQDLGTDRVKLRQMSIASRQLAKPYATAQVAAICAAYAGYDFDNTAGKQQ